MSCPGQAFVRAPVRVAPNPWSVGVRFGLMDVTYEFLLASVEFPRKSNFVNDTKIAG